MFGCLVENVGRSISSLRFNLRRWFPARSARARSRQVSPAKYSLGANVETIEPRLMLTVQFAFDYSFDANHFFDTQPKKDLLELAGHMLGDRLNDSLSAITPSGANTWTPSIFNPATGQPIDLPSSTSIAANQIRVYVGSRVLGGSELGEAGAGGWSSFGSADWNNTVKGRGQAGALLSTPTDTSVWGGEIAFDKLTSWSFDKTTSSLSSGKSDFLSVSLHELEHLLGFISFNPAFSRLTTASGFNGAASKSLNGGRVVPLDPDQSHWREGTTSDGVETEMDPTLTQGTRKFTSSLDFAALADIGWQVRTTDDTIATAAHKFTLQNIGSHVVTSGTPRFSASIESSKDDDIYRIFVTAGSKFTAAVLPTAGLNSYIRLFDVAGTQLAFADQGGSGIVDTLAFTAPRTDYYYVGVSSFGNRGYNPNVANSGAGGQTGGYSVTISTVNSAPVLAGTSTLPYTENQAATAINTAIIVSDLDNATLASGIVKMTNFVAGQDVLGFLNVKATMGNIAGIVNNATGVITLSSTGSTATIAQWQAALRAVTYRNSSKNPSTANRVVTFMVDDGQVANHASNSITSTITVKAINDAPVLAGISAITYTKNQAAVAIDTAIVVSDVDNTTLKSGIVKMTNFVADQDVLGFLNVAATMGNIIGMVNNLTGVVTLSSVGSTATIAQWQAALRAVTYRNSSKNPSTTTRSVTFSVDDGQMLNHASNLLTSTITIKAVNIASVLAGIETTPSKSPANAPVMPIASRVLVADLDNPNLTGAAIQNARNYENRRGVLSLSEAGMS